MAPQIHTYSEVEEWMKEHRGDLEYLMNHMEPKPESIDKLVIEVLAGSVASMMDTLTQEDTEKEMKVVSIDDICKECGQLKK